MMTTDKDRAEVYRELADELPTDAYWDRSALTHKADLLDPPKPTYPDGTYAAVTCANDFLTRSYFARRFAGEWVTADGRCVCADQDVTKVEPLRVLADDEIALPVVTKMTGQLRDDADQLDDSNGYGNPSAAVLRSYADALDAEAGEQS